MQVDKIMKANDVNGDGQLDFEEFLKYFQKISSALVKYKAFPLKAEKKRKQKKMVTIATGITGITATAATTSTSNESVLASISPSTGKSVVRGESVMDRVIRVASEQGYTGSLSLSPSRVEAEFTRGNDVGFVLSENSGNEDEDWEIVDSNAWKEDPNFRIVGVDHINMSEQDSEVDTKVVKATQPEPEPKSKFAAMR